MRTTFFHRMSTLYMGLVYLFLYIPILVLIIYSFNESKINAVWMGFTFKWYRMLIDDKAILAATQNSLTIAVASTLISTMLGTLTAVGMYKYKFKGSSALDAMLYIPVIIPEIVMGIAMLAFFSLVDISLGMFTLIIAHITFSLPFVVIVVRARLQGFDRSLEEAAMDLGAGYIQTFMKVTLPIILPGIVAGALLAFTLSIDDVIISFFVAGPACTTLPLKVFSMVKFGVSPAINALSTVMLMVIVPLVIIAEGIRLKN